MDGTLLGFAPITGWRGETRWRRRALNSATRSLRSRSASAQHTISPLVRTCHFSAEISASQTPKETLPSSAAAGNTAGGRWHNATPGWRRRYNDLSLENVGAILAVLDVGPYFDAIVRQPCDARQARSAGVQVAPRSWACRSGAVWWSRMRRGRRAKRRADACIGVGPAHGELPADIRVASLDLLDEDAFDRLLS